jgi:hypothetical protein
MPTTPKKPGSQVPQQRTPTRNEQLRARGLRPVRHWVPDLRNPKILEEIRREGAMMAKHPDNDAIDAWIEEVYDWDAWK